LNWVLLIAVLAAEKVSDVRVDGPNVAVLVGTAAGVQLPAVFQSLEPGVVDHVAFCARAGQPPTAETIRATVTSNRYPSRIPTPPTIVQNNVLR
jgi:hypothetical protein